MSEPNKYHTGKCDCEICRVQLQIRLECLKDELKWIMPMARNIRKNCECEICTSYRARISQLQKEIKELEKK